MLLLRGTLFVTGLGLSACTTAQESSGDGALGQWQGQWRAGEGLLRDDALDPVYEIVSEMRPEYPPGEVRALMVLTYFTRGRATVEQGQRFELHAGDVYLVPAGSQHAIAAVESAAAWRVDIEPACVSSTLLVPFQRASSGGSKVVPIDSGRQRHVESLCQELHRETSGASRSSRAQLVRQSLLTLLLAEVGRAAPDQVEMHPGLVEETLRVIERRCLGPLSVAEVARSVARTPSYLSTAVRRATGRSKFGSVPPRYGPSRSAVARLQVLEDRDRLPNASARVGLQHRDRARWVLGQERRRTLLARDHVDLDELEVVDALLRRVDVDAARVGAPGELIELHVTSVGGRECAQ